MRTVALRFGENIAPKCGTIKAHSNIITRHGEVWYGKFGLPLSDKVISDILENEEPKVLLIHSGTTNRFWAFVSKIQKNTPDISKVPEYYRHEKDRVKTWFCIYRFENAEKDIMSKCKVASSGALLSNASRHSMSPYFIIDCEE